MVVSWVLLAPVAAVVRASVVEVVGAGASLPAQLYKEVATAYRFASSDKMNYESIGSTAGIKAILGEDPLRTLDFAGSDQLLTKDDYAAAPDAQMYPSAVGFFLL